MKTESITYTYPPTLQHEPGEPSHPTFGPNPADTALVPGTEAAVAPPPEVGAANALIQLSNHPSRGGKPRNGKIARLPKPVRDMVNRMLFHNIPQGQIVLALDEIGITVTQRNISNWKNLGGYREWRLAQEHAIQLQNHQDNLTDLLRRDAATEVPEVGLQAAATQLSSFFLTPEAQQLLRSNPKEYERRVSMLARITAQVKGLQKYRDDSARALGFKHDPDHIRRDTDHTIDRIEDCYLSTVPKTSREPAIPHRNRLPDRAKLFHCVDEDNGTGKEATLGELFYELAKRKADKDADHVPDTAASQTPVAKSEPQNAP